jgi:hypothetical protein
VLEEFGLGRIDLVTHIAFQIIPFTLLLSFLLFLQLSLTQLLLLTLLPTLILRLYHCLALFLLFIVLDRLAYLRDYIFCLIFFNSIIE